MKPTLEIHDGRVCVRLPIIHTFEPKVTWHYWPTTENAGEITQRFPSWIGRELLSASCGQFSIQMGDRPFSGWHTINLVDGGKTQPIHSVTEDIPPPKTKLEVRWDGYRERWEKKLKSGWQPA